jgi:hypothetical protein
MCFCLGFVVIQRPMSQLEWACIGAALPDLPNERSAMSIHITVVPWPRILLDIPNPVQPICVGKLHPSSKELEMAIYALFWSVFYPVPK